MSVSVVNTKQFITFCEAPNRNIPWNEWCTPEFEQKVKSLVERYILSSEINANVATPFLAALKFVNNQYQQFRGIQPFADEIQKVNDQLLNKKGNSSKPIIATNLEKNSKPAVTATSVKSLAAQFHSSALIEAKIAPSGKKVILAIATPQAKIGSIKDRIIRLDLDNPNLKSEIKAIIEDLNQLKNKQLVSKETYDSLVQALEHVKVGYSFDMADAFLRSLALFLKQKFPKDSSKKIDLGDYETIKKMENRNARSNLLKALKKMATSADFLIGTSSAINQLSTFEKETIANFYNSLVLRYKKQFSLFHANLTSDFLLTCKTFSNIDHVVAEQLKKEFDVKENLLDSSSNQLFSKFLGYYSYLNCLSDSLRPIFINKYCSAFFTSFLLENDQIKSPEKEVSESFNRIYNGYFAKRHQWLAQNAHHIEKPYNQGDDPDTPGKGMCFNNCLDRFAIFLATSTIDPKDIPMQSSREGRFAQTRSEIGVHGLAEQNKKNYNELADVEQKMMLSNLLSQVRSLELTSLNRLNLQQAHKPIEITGNSSEEAVNSLLVAIRELNNQTDQSLQFLLGLHGKIGAHAMNIQLDKKRKVYRFIDDNLGICEYSDGKSFALALSSYLKVFYSDMMKFKIDFFETKKPR